MNVIDGVEKATSVVEPRRVLEGIVEVVRGRSRPAVARGSRRIGRRHREMLLLQLRKEYVSKKIYRLCDKSRRRTTTQRKCSVRGEQERRPDFMGEGPSHMIASRSRKVNICVTYTRRARNSEQRSLYSPCNTRSNERSLNFVPG